MRYVFIVNPVAGKGKGPDTVVPKINEYFKNADNYNVYITTYKGEAREIAEREAKTGDQVRIFPCGGEGTFFEALNGVIGYKNVEIGVIPCGTANDFLKYFGQKDLFFDIAKMCEGESVEVDLIKADDMYCINQCSVGMDAIVAERMQKFKKLPLVNGKTAYTLAIIKLFLGKIGLELNIKIDDNEPFKKDCLFAVCANGPVYGGGYSSAPSAVPFDGKLDFAIVDTVSKFKVIPFLKSYSDGTHEKYDFCSIGNCKTMEIYADKPFPVNLDGEIISKDHVKFELVKKAVRFILPKEIAAKLPREENCVIA